MAVEVIWLDQARDDINDILRYISLESPKAADRYIDDLIGATLRLADFPESARRYDARFRCIPCRNHLILYRFDGAAGVVWISAVIDGRRDVEAALDTH